jgi:HSP20 family protein
MFSLIPRRERREMTRHPFEWVPREFAPLFERMFSALPIEPLWETNWGLDAEERENEYVLRATVPGFEASELEVSVTGNVLTLRAEHRRPEGEPADERPVARLERTLTLPLGLNLEAIEARYRNGILEVHIPRIPEARPRRIEVKA